VPPVLTSLNQIYGVDHSYADSSGTFIRLTLRPGSDPEKVITEARRVVEEQVEDRTTVPLYGQGATQALRQQWKYEGQPAQPAADEARPTEVHASGHLGLAVLLLALMAVVFGLLVCWRR
jgi:hypothetical protein